MVKYFDARGWVGTLGWGGSTLTVSLTVEYKFFLDAFRYIIPVLCIANGTSLLSGFAKKTTMATKSFCMTFLDVAVCSHDFIGNGVILQRMQCG